MIRVAIAARASPSLSAQRFDLSHEGLGIGGLGVVVSDMASLRIRLIWYQVTDLFLRHKLQKVVWQK
jgi:hypothetical protein